MIDGMEWETWVGPEMGSITDDAGSAMESISASDGALDVAAELL